MIHKEPHLKAGQVVKIIPSAKHPQIKEFGGAEFEIEDWWDRVAGKSWKWCDGNPACLIYAMRTGLNEYEVPTDDEVVYGKIGAFGHLVHVNELEDHA